MRQVDRAYRICSRTVMDTSDSKITFDASGVCDHAIDFDLHIKPFWPPGASRRAALAGTRRCPVWRGPGKPREQQRDTRVVVGT